MQKCSLVSYFAHTLDAECRRCQIAGDGMVQLIVRSSTKSVRS